MIVFAHRGHSYEDRAQRVVYVIPHGTYKEIPEKIGELIVRAHPDKLCDVTNEAEPGNHKCEKTVEGEVMHTMLPSPPRTTRVHMSDQKRELRKDAVHRSKIARMRIRRENVGHKADNL